VSTERARVNATNAHVDADDFQRQVIAEIRQAWGDYRTVLQQLESSKKGLQAAQKAYEVVEGRYQVGSASFVDLTTAQAALVQAEASRAQALIAFALQTRTMETTLGTSVVE
jgi:outer membrane protein